MQYVYNFFHLRVRQFSFSLDYTVSLTFQSNESRIFTKSRTVTLLSLGSPTSKETVKLTFT